VSPCSSVSTITADFTWEMVQRDKVLYKKTSTGWIWDKVWGRKTFLTEKEKGQK
jgi:hypothetical protein